MAGMLVSTGNIAYEGALCTDSVVQIRCLETTSAPNNQRENLAGNMQCDLELTECEGGMDWHGGSTMHGRICTSAVRRARIESTRSTLVHTQCTGFPLIVAIFSGDRMCLFERSRVFFFSLAMLVEF